MLEDLNGRRQPEFGDQPHWGFLRNVMAVPAVFEPLRAEVERLVGAAIDADPVRPCIDSRRAGAEALGAVGPGWHDEFARRFPNLPDGATNGVFGMALWHHLAGRPDRWSFAGIADPHAGGPGSMAYFRFPPA